MYSKSEVLEFVKEEDVKFIKLAFVDVFGKQKNVSITDNELDRAFKTGVAIDASAISPVRVCTAEKCSCAVSVSV
ncbi:MAG: glutamine synthetase beta-grasp domain-containing protein [Clostridia bacterium]|nr:glutamine synthetase beta-grasp domain-containing protein [Clostridia bacterium]